jgi:hypothetical protein
MQCRTGRAVSRTREASEAIVTALARTQVTVSSRARSPLSGKLLTDHSEEASTSARILDAVVAVRDVRSLPAMFLRDVDSLPIAFLLRYDTPSSFIISSSKVSVSDVCNWAAVYCDVVLPAQVR